MVQTAVLELLIVYVFFLLYLEYREAIFFFPYVDLKKNDRFTFPADIASCVCISQFVFVTMYTRTTFCDKMFKGTGHLCNCQRPAADFTKR